MDRHSREGVMLLVLIGLLIIFFGLVALAHVAPFFTASVVCFICLATWYMDERSSIHSAQEIENRVVTLLAFTFSTCLFFIDDSPLSFGCSYPGCGVLGVLAFTFGMHIYDRQTHRDRASRRPLFPSMGQPAPPHPHHRANASSSYPLPSSSTLRYRSHHNSPSPSAASSRTPPSASSSPPASSSRHRHSLSMPPTIPHSSSPAPTPTASSLDMYSSQPISLLSSRSASPSSRGRGGGGGAGAGVRAATTAAAAAAMAAEEDDVFRLSVEETVGLIHGLLARLDKTFIATNIAFMAQASTVRKLEEGIIDGLSSCTRTELNEAIPLLKLGLILYKVKDRTGSPNRTRLLDLLAKDRLSDLDVRSKAHVLDAMQVMMLRAHGKGSSYVLGLLKSTKGDELSMLKSLTDCKGDFHSLHKLVYTDITDEKTRTLVLQHIAKEGAVQAAHMAMNTSMAKRRKGMAWRKILSDVDDTLTSSGGRFPAGVDKIYPKKAIYPGILDLYRELDLGTEGSDEWTRGRVGNLVLLSARPHFYKDFSERKTYAKTGKLQAERALYTSPTLLAGSMDTGTRYIIGSTEPMARKKFENFCEYMCLYPEFKYVFIGDNGQGDVRAAEMMIEAYPSAFDGVYMHQVLPLEETYGFKGPETLQRWRELGIVFVKNYVDAAVHAYGRTATKQALIRASGLRRICRQVVTDFEQIAWTDLRHADEQRQELNASLLKARQALVRSGEGKEGEGDSGDGGNLGIELIRAKCFFVPGTEVQVGVFGVGVVTAFREEDGMYEVALGGSAPCDGSEDSPAAPPGGGSGTSVAASPSHRKRFALSRSPSPLIVSHASSMGGSDRPPSPLSLRKGSPTSESRSRTPSPRSAALASAASAGIASATAAQTESKRSGLAAPSPLETLETPETTTEAEVCAEQQQQQQQQRQEQLMMQPQEGISSPLGPLTSPVREILHGEGLFGNTSPRGGDEGEVVTSKGSDCAGEAEGERKGEGAGERGEGREGDAPHTITYAAGAAASVAAMVTASTPPSTAIAASAPPPSPGVAGAGAGARAKAGAGAPVAVAVAVAPANANAVASPPPLAMENLRRNSARVRRAKRVSGMTAYVQLSSLCAAPPSSKPKPSKRGVSTPSSFFSFLPGGGGREEVSFRPLAAGTLAVCALGPVSVRAFRAEDCIYEVEMQDWKLATGASPLAYIHASGLRGADSPSVKGMDAGRTSFFRKMGNLML